MLAAAAALGGAGEGEALLRDMLGRESAAVRAYPDG